MAELNNKDNATPAKKGRTRKAAPKVDLTAMVDLAFLLITFFMLTTSLNKPNALDVAVPDKNIDEAVDMDERRIVNLIVREDSYTLIHGDISKPIRTVQHITATNQSLKDNLDEFSQYISNLTSGKKTIVLIKPTAEANTKGIIDSFDEIRSSDIKQYMLSKLSKEEEHLVNKVK
ncbi:ExbD/TolR family protein [Sphingobacterium sp. SGL-16]|uniref:ExbD/TolR family protein n=1 Tax=Sphingobacterium sp. SGL-16 TaxID=2710883 RepID=UPI0013E9BDF0|nr:biopolymer transporter ExbD [Sphingobacterium sp. SGL-16]NGM72590.1 biopolymer transporter ExbD [Sphingobacterium sp. SGL-16]